MRWATAKKNDLDRLFRLYDGSLWMTTFGRTLWRRKCLHIWKFRMVRVMAFGAGGSSFFSSPTADLFSMQSLIPIPFDDAVALSAECRDLVIADGRAVEQIQGIWFFRMMT